MKTFIALLFLSLAAVLPAATDPAHEHATVYQCPMHPWIKSDHAGAKCTICGMELVAATGAETPADANVVTLTPGQVAVTGIQTQESGVCISGEILRGVKKPCDCPAFGKECSPQSPLGATMVSSEGACAAYHAYGRHLERPTARELPLVG